MAYFAKWQNMAPAFGILGPIFGMTPFFHKLTCVNIFGLLCRQIGQGIREETKRRANG